MANVYSTCFYRGVIPTASTVLYTVPTGFVAIVRDITVYNAMATSRKGLTGWLIQDDNANPIYATLATSPSNLTTYQWQGREVLTAGQTVVGLAYDGSWKVRVNGYLLTTP